MHQIVSDYQNSTSSEGDEEAEAATAVFLLGSSLCLLPHLFFFKAFYEVPSCFVMKYNCVFIKLCSESGSQMEQIQYLPEPKMLVSFCTKRSAVAIATTGPHCSLPVRPAQKKVELALRLLDPTGNGEK